MRDAEPLIKDPAVLEEARTFRAQEAIHSMAHRKHVKALIARYPGLQIALDRLVAHFDALYEAKDLKYHLAYAGGLESIFTPSFTLLLDNRDVLFGGGDARVASLLIWHFCEEIEHRSSALNVYNYYSRGDYHLPHPEFPELHEARQRRRRHSERGVQKERAMTCRTEYVWREDEKHASAARADLRSAWASSCRKCRGTIPTIEALPAYYAEWMTTLRQRRGRHANFWRSSATARLQAAAG